MSNLNVGGLSRLPTGVNDVVRVEYHAGSLSPRLSPREPPSIDELAMKRDSVTSLPVLGTALPLKSKPSKLPELSLGATISQGYDATARRKSLTAREPPSSARRKSLLGDLRRNSSSLSPLARESVPKLTLNNETSPNSVVNPVSPRSDVSIGGSKSRLVPLGLMTMPSGDLSLAGTAVSPRGTLRKVPSDVSNIPNGPNGQNGQHVTSPQNVSPRPTRRRQSTASARKNAGADTRPTPRAAPSQPSSTETNTQTALCEVYTKGFQIDANKARFQSPIKFFDDYLLYQFFHPDGNEYRVLIMYSDVIDGVIFGTKFRFKVPEGQFDFSEIDKKVGPDHSIQIDFQTRDGANTIKNTGGLEALKKHVKMS